MRLLMYIAGDLIEDEAVDYTQVSTPGYLSSVVRRVKQKHACQLTEHRCEPEFLVQYLTQSFFHQPAGQPFTSR